MLRLGSLTARSDIGDGATAHVIERRGKEAFLDSLFVMEEGMRHYFSKAMQAKTNNMKPEIVDNYMQKAIGVAEKVAPYRHARLSAVKLAGRPKLGIEIRQKIAQRAAKGETPYAIAKALSISAARSFVILPVLNPTDASTGT